MTANNERQAEIEDVARIIRDEMPYAVKHSTAARIAERVLAEFAPGDTPHPTDTRPAPHKEN